VLAYLRKGETLAELAAGFGVGIATAWRYVEEAGGLLADRRRGCARWPGTQGRPGTRTWSWTGR
jgi:Helix-turn-helix of DDE superfamily endonuclease